jgi:hypothetical protein
LLFELPKRHKIKSSGFFSIKYFLWSNMNNVNAGPKVKRNYTRIFTRLSAVNALWIISFNVTIEMPYQKSYKILANFNCWNIELYHFILMLGNILSPSSKSSRRSPVPSKSCIMISWKVNILLLSKLLVLFNNNNKLSHNMEAPCE